VSELNNMGEDAAGCLSRVAVVAGNTRVVAGNTKVVVGNTRVVVDIIRAVEGQGHITKVVGHLSITRVTTRDVVVTTRDVVATTRDVVVNTKDVVVNTRDVVAPVPEEVECHSHTMAGKGEEVVVDEMFLQVHPEQFPSCTKPHMSSIKPRWFHHPRRDLAHPHSL
jgi:hypothetical protein